MVISKVCKKQEWSTANKQLYQFIYHNINQLNAQILFYNKLIKCLYMFRALCAHHREVKILGRSLSRVEEDGRKWFRGPKLCTKSCRAVL